ncbi:hypothetical protein GE061_005744 [Apolygus lucorum]|uniref:Uncharacterized protein n=1 Tax=Apolygus lucorum TaxID=248454 RepID=A0A8S9WZR7_APOLU|nr:hypothetical protein GE061_005744 [Apolygus lucorum]
MVMSVIGLMTTLYESSSQNMNDNIREVWSSHFGGSTTMGTESLRKSIMTAIALARGLTVHIYIAAYILMFYPFFFERGITLLLLWMLICTIRSVIVNLFALFVGCIICSSYSDLKPVCFEFSASKAIEIACSVYMWLSVNDYHIKLRARRRNLIASKMLAKTTQISDSDMSLLSTDISYMDFDEEVEASADSVMAKAAVDWLTKSAFGTKYQSRMVTDTVGTRTFLNMSAEELKELQKRINNKLREGLGFEDVVSKELLLGSDENIQEPTEKLETQSVSSQTQEPSKKLEQRLSKQEILLESTASTIEKQGGYTLTGQHLDDD